MKTFEHDGCEWYVNDTRGYLDAGPACDDCGACECGREPFECCGCKPHADDDCECCEEHEPHCIGLSIAYVCLDGGDALCEDCAVAAGLPV